jgi:hypothetical protein
MELGGAVVPELVSSAWCGALVSDRQACHLLFRWSGGGWRWLRVLLRRMRVQHEDIGAAAPCPKNIGARYRYVLYRPVIHCKKKDVLFQWAGGLIGPFKPETGPPSPRSTQGQKRVVYPINRYKPGRNRSSNFPIPSRQSR